MWNISIFTVTFTNNLPATTATTAQDIFSINLTLEHVL